MSGPKILDVAASGEPESAASLCPLVYEELRRLARARMARLAPGQALTPTDLVHDAYVRIVGSGPERFEGCKHLFFAFSRAMRDLLIEGARRGKSLKRGGNSLQLGDEVADIAVEDRHDDTLELALALEKLERECPDRAHVVHLSYFAGLTHPEIAQVLGLSLATVERRWSYARIWLRRELSRPPIDRHD